MKKRIFFILLLLFLALCACTQEPITESVPPAVDETVTPTSPSEPTGSPEITPSPTPAVSPEPSAEASGLPDEGGENDPPAEPDKPELLPIYPHTMDAGFNDFYIIDENGTLLMWGDPEYGSLKGGTFENGPSILMENVAAVYTTSGASGSTVAITTDGTLWGLNGYFCNIAPGNNRENENTPIRLIEDVAMISEVSSHRYILKRDGSLWHLGTDEGYPGYHNHSWIDPKNPEKSTELSLTKIMDNVIFVCATTDGGMAITSDYTLWEWYSSHVIKKVMENVLWADIGTILTQDGTLLQLSFEAQSHQFSTKTILYNVCQAEWNFILQNDGTLLFKGSFDGALKQIMADVAEFSVAELGILIQKKDGSYWHQAFRNFGQDILQSSFCPSRIFP